MHGGNTDTYGFMHNLRQAIPALTPYLEHVVVLGAGGAARAVVGALLDAKAKQITLLNRTHARADALAHVRRGR